MQASADGVTFRPKLPHVSYNISTYLFGLAKSANGGLGRRDVFWMYEVKSEMNSCALIFLHRFFLQIL